MIEVLQYVPSFAFGGIETFVLNMNEKLKNQFHFTYLVEMDIDEELRKRINSYGADIIRIDNMTKESFLGHIKQVKKVLKEGNYDIVHVHGCDIRIFVMFFSKVYGIKKRIYHLHSSRIERHEKIKKFFLKINMFYSNCLLACSKESAEKMYGKRSKDALIVNNAIDLDMFGFNQESRNRIRKELKISENDIVIGHIGRLSEVKNQEYLIKIIERYSQKSKNCKLLIIGDGDLRERLLQKVEEKKLDKYVIFMGAKRNTSQYYSAFDIFCLPSLSEGLGIVLIEAQANGLKCIVSNNVPKEANITGELQFLNIMDENIDDWVKDIELKAKNRYNKTNILKEKGYDISISANRLAQIYLTKEKEIETTNK